MVAVVLAVICVVCYIWGKSAALTVAVVISCFVPDEIPFVDEAIETTLLVKLLFSKVGEENKDGQGTVSCQDRIDGIHKF